MSRMDITTVKHKVGDAVTSPDGTEFTVLAVRPHDSHASYRLVCRRTGGDVLAVVSILVDEEGNTLGQIPRDSYNGYRWDTVIPLACELRVLDVLPPATKLVGRPSKRFADTSVPGLQTVTQVEVRYDGDLEVYTKDANAQYRRWIRNPMDVLAPGVPKAIKNNHLAEVFPDYYTGPYYNMQGAQFVFKRRPYQRPRRNDPEYNDDVAPRVDPNTGELMPFVVMEPPRSRKVSCSIGDPSEFTTSARLLPQVQFILRDHGMLPEKEQDSEEA